jgi:acylphosphatase
MPLERRRVYFSGRVQGVGFRFACRALARDFRVAGFVRNLPDGRVELLAEGEPGEVTRFVSAIQDEMRGYIEDTVSELQRPGDQPLSGFVIRY